MSMNKVFIMGRLTSDPTVRHTQSGSSVASFTLAVDRNGKEKVTDFIECVAWKNTADFVGNYFSKGRMAVVEGRLQIRDWVDKEGTKRKATEVIVDNIYFGDSKAKGDPLDSFAKEHPEVQFTEVDDDTNLPF